MLAKPTCIAETARRSIAAFALFAIALVASPLARSQNAVNTASVTPPATVTDPNSANNSATDSDTIVRSANLALTKTATPNPVVLGQTLTYTLTVANGGPSAILASDTFSIQEALPAGLTGCAYTPSGGTFNPGSIAPGATGTGTWTGLAIPSGGNATLTIACTVGPSTAASISNTATVIPPTGVSDPDCAGSPVTCGGNNTSTVGTTVNSPQLTITKTASAPSFTVGVPASYTLSVQNTGTAATTAAATITDTIPTGLTIGTLPAGCTAAGQTVTCTIASGLAVNATTSFVIPVTPTAAAQPSVTNTATVNGGGDPTCPAAAHCTGTAGPTPVNVPVLTLTKTASAASFTVGVPASYTITVTNTGTATTSGNITVTDTIPTGLTIGALPGGCTAAGQTVTCTLTTAIAVGGSSNIIIPVTPTTAAQPSVTNSATASGGGDPTCPAAAHCTGTAGPTPVNAPVLTLTKTASASPWTVGVAASYTLSVQNTGTAATTAVATITDTIPTGLTIGVLPAGCTSAGQVVTCTIAAGLAASATTTFVIPVTPTVAAQPSVSNTASVSGGGDPTCPAAAHCTSTAGPTPVNAPVLTLTKTASASPWTVGVAASYTLSVQNTGTAATTAAATITDTIPTGLTIGVLPAGCTAAGQVVTCTIASGLAVSATTTFVIPVTPTVAAQPSVSNTASVSGGGDPTCPAAAHCTSTAGPTPVNAPVLTLTKTASASPWTVGVAASYTLSVQNTGTAATTAAATITDTIPTGLTIGVLPAGCTAAGQVVTCTIASGLAVSATTTFVIPVTPTVAAQPSVSNTASVSGGGDPTCPAAAHCTSTAGPTPVNAPVLTLTKTASASPWTVGVAASYTLSVQNTGTAATTAAATITDTIPTSLTIGVLPAGCTAAGQTVTCTIAAGLAASATTSFVIPVTPTVAAQPSVSNTASVSGGGDPTCPAAAHCTSTAGPTPVNAPVLTLTKTASVASFTVGTPASYTLSVQNTGTAATTAAATITDTIPTGLTIGVLPAGCTAAGQTVTCTIAAGLAASATTSFVIPVTPTATAASSVTNTATVNGGGDPTCPAAAHCTSSVTTAVDRANINVAKVAGAVTGPSPTGTYTVDYVVTVTNSGTAAGSYGPLFDGAVFSANLNVLGATWTTSGAGAPPGGSNPGVSSFPISPANTAIGAGVTHTYNLTFTFSYADNNPASTCSPTPNPGDGLYNEAALPAGQEDGSAADNATCVNVPPPPPLLTLTKTASASPWTVGVPASYTLSVQNTGGVATTAAATITDTIPTGLTIGTLPAGCTAAGQTVTCTIPSGLAVNATTSFVIPVTPTAAAQPSVSNTASLSGGGDPTCPAATHCTSTAGPTPVNAPELTLTKTASAAAFAVGVPASYTLSVQNTGTAATTAVATITDTIPTGLTIGTLPAGCTAAGQTVTCTVPAGLAVSATTAFVIPVTPTAAAQPSVTNTATVSGGGDPTCPAAAHCTGTAGPTPVNAPELTLTKTASAASFSVGVPASYTLSVQNTGTAATTAVATITDTIPTGLTIGTLPAGCTAAGQTVTCTVPAGLAVSATTSFVIPVTPTAAAQPSVTNTASVSGGGDPTCPAAAHCTSTAGPTPVNAPELTLTKTASAASFTVGVPASYTLSVQNTGTAATTAAATITDTIPTGLTIGTLPAGCTAAGQTVTCTVPAGLAVSATTSFVIPVTPTAAAQPSVTNTATVNGGGDPTCPAAAHCTGTVGPTPVNAPELTLTKTASAASFSVGVPASYTLSVQNTGTAATTAAATITDTIPTGLTIGTLPAGCTAAGQTVTCTIPAGLAVSATTAFVIPVTPTAAAQPSVTNTATVNGGGDPTCPAAAHCTSTAGPTPVNAPELTLTKTASAAAFSVGVPASYTLSVQNTGTAATTAAATITDTIPAGLTIGTLPAGCTAAGQTVTCTIPAGLAVSATTAFVVPVTPTAAAQPSVTNTASVSGGGDPTCPAAAHCTSTAGPTPVGGAELTLQKTASASPWTVGVAASYTLQVTNTGSAPTTAAATITDTIPASLTIGTLPAGCTAAGQTVTCTIPAGLAVSASTSFVIPVTPTASAAPSVTNTATVSGGGDPTCPAAAHCTSTAGPTPVDPSADVAIVKSQATPNPAVPGQAVTWTITVTNNGPSDAAGVQTADTVPASVTGLTVGGADAASCTVAGQSVTCNFGTVANGATRTYTITGTLAASFTGSLSNTATVTSTTSDPTPGNNSSTSSTPSATTVDAAITKTLLTASPVAAGGTVTYQLVVTNAGPSNLVGGTVTDTVPSELTGVTWSCAATGSASCGAASGSGNVSLSVDIAADAGNAVTVTVTGTAPVTTPNTIGANTATVAVPVGTTDPNPGNNSSTVPPISVTALVIDAVDDTGTVANGAAGGTAVPNVLVNDTLNGVPATLANVTLSQVSTSNPNVTLNPATGAVNVAPGTPAGTYTLVYQICEQLNPTNCDTATVTVTVGAAVIDAVDDTGTVANGAAGGTAVPNVLVNDTLNGAPATLANVTLTQVSTSNPNVTLNPATGAVNVAPGTPAGTYTLVYQICEQLNPTNCDTATVTVTVGAAVIDAVDDSYGPVNGAVGATTPSVLANDTLGGSPATVGAGGNVTLTPGTAPTPASGSITMNADGTITVAAGTTAGTYTYPYTICEALNPTNCDTATATITVAAAVIDAVDDTGTVANGAAGGTAVPNVLVNDTLNGAPATLANVTLTQVSTSNPNVTINPATGAVNVAPGTPAGTYTLVYQICEQLNPANCDTATVTVTVGAAVIDAVDDTGTVANGAAGGTAVPNVLVNDTLNGAPVTLANVTLTQVSTSNPNVTLNPATGAVNVAPGTPAGTYTLVYQICEQLNPTNCDTATVTVTVGAAVIDAVDDSYGPVNGAAGGTTGSVLANDTLGGSPATVGAGGNVTLTPGTAPTPAAGSITMNADGTITVAAGTTAGTYTYPYTICEALNPTNCDTATATITVAAAVIDAVDDTGTVANGAAGGTAVPNVLVNDTLNGAPVTLANVTLTQVSTSNPNVTLNPATGAVNVAPGTPAGTYTLVYQICEQLNPTNCDTATVTVTVGAAVIDAVDDTGTVANGAAGGTAVPNVLVNDTLNGAPVTLANVTLTQVSTSNPNVTLNPATGAVNVAPGTPAGTYTLVYQICEQLNPTNCDTATVTVTVGAAVIDAVDDTGTVANGAAGGTAVPNVLVNDTLNGAPATLANVTLTQVSTSNPNVTLNPATGAVNVAPGTPAGTYTLVYQICEQLNPTNCDTATVTVTVGAAVIDAVDDTGTVANGAAGGTAVPNVLVNDTLNGAPATLATVTLTQVSTSNPNVTLNPATGAVNVAPGTPAGTYTLVYQICEQLNPTNCDTATVTVTVGAAVIDAVDDTGTVANGVAGGTAVPNVLVNDTLNGAPATLANVTLTQVSTSNPNVTLNPATGAVNVAPGTPAGTYTLVYQICEQLNPTNCDTATVTVTVGAAVIDAVDDTGTVANGAAGGTAVPNVLVNDTLNGAPATLANVTLSQVSTSNPNVTLNPATGAVNVAPGTPAGTYTLVYQICEQLNPTNCDTATVTVTVGAAVIDAVDDTGTVANGAAGGTAVPNVLVNDTLNGAPATLANVTITQVSTSNQNVTINPATGAVNVAPGTPAGTYTLVYQICEQLNPTNCDTATVTVTVGAAVIDAVDDTGTVANGAAGGTAVPNVLVNDTLNGAPATLANVTLTQVSTSNPNVTLNPATGAVNVAPGTPAGTYTLVYQICEQLNPTNCDTATVTVTVGAAVIDAVDDTGTVANGAAGGTAVPNVLVNDTLNGAPATLATVTLTQVSTTNPNVTLNPATGAVNVAPGTPAGTYTLVYQICEQLNPTNCDTATVTVTVGAAVIDAVDDSYGPINGGGTTASVLVNDTLNGVPVNPADVTLTPGVAPTPATGSLVMNPDGTITVAAGTEAGTYTYPYTICEALNPSNCDSAVATVIVAAQPGLTLDKIAGTPTANAAGATIPYSFMVTNTGNVTVTGLVINDAQLDAAAVCPTTTLAPGASTTCTGTHTITQAEVDAGTVDNTATATGTLPGNGGNTVSPPDSTSTPITQNPAISATKTATLTTDNGVPGMADEGDVITYAVSVTNSGNVTLNSLVVSDSFEGGAPTTLNCTPTSLAPGATATCASYTHTVTAAEALAGGTLDNVATATGRSQTSAQTVTSTSTAVVAVNGAPATIRVTKTASPHDVHVGDLVRYTVTMENTSQTAMTDGTLIDTPPAGFTYVDGSLRVADADNAGRLVGTYPIRVDQIDIAGGDRATITYLLRVGAGVRAGIHTNTAVVEDNGDVVSNTATADVQLVADPLLDDSLILGTVFNDRDGDGWQDAAGLGDVHVQGGFAPEAYVPSSTTVDRGTGPKPEADASAPMLHGIAIGDITARQSEGDAVANHTVVVRQKLRELRFTDDFVLTSAQGVTVRMAADGSTRVEKSGDAAKGLNAAEPTVSRRVSQVADGYLVDYVIANAGIDERGIPGVRLATVEGLLVETDQFGRYHLAGVDGGRWERGRNLILKVDPATLPPGTVFTTDNPLVKRVTPGVPARFDFGVKLPVSVLEGASQSVEMELGSVMFAPDSAEIRPQYRPAIDRIAETAQGHAGGEIVIGAEGDSDLLAFERAIAVRDALVAKLSPETAAGLRISVRANPHDPDSTVVGVMEWPLIGTFLFETDRAEIKPEYRPLIQRIADYLVAIGTTRVAVVGHADKRGSEDYNVALGMRRAKAVYDAIAEALPAEARNGLRVDINEDPAAPAGMNGQ